MCIDLHQEIVACLCHAENVRKPCSSAPGTSAGTGTDLNAHEARDDRLGHCRARHTRCGGRDLDRRRLARDNRPVAGNEGKPAAEWINEFDAIERRFAPQARIIILLVLLSGLYMLYRYDLWNRFTRAEYWWMDLMVGVWLLFAALLFVIEPLGLRRIGGEDVRAAPEATLTRMLRLHRTMLILSLLAVFAAVGGSYGLF